MKRIFMDTVGFLALWDEDDQWHEAADSAWKSIDPQTSMFTTSYILLECGNAAARMPYRRAVEDLRTQYEIARTLVHPSPEDWESAWASYARNEATGAGIVDQISFVVMRRLRITDVFTNDRHFKAAGFNTLF